MTHDPTSQTGPSETAHHTEGAPKSALPRWGVYPRQTKPLLTKISGGEQNPGRLEDVQRGWPLSTEIAESDRKSATYTMPLCAVKVGEAHCHSLFPGFAS